MNSTKCMQCGLVNWQTEAFCKRCKAPIASASQAYEYQQAQYQQPQYQQPPPPVYPYSPPPPPQDFSQLPDYPHMPPPPVQMQAGVWRDGSVLVMSKMAALPPVCVKCNRAVGQADFRRKLYWHPRSLYLLLLVSWVVYLIVVLVVRKQATINFGVCENHRSQRRYIIAICWVLAALGAAGLMAAIMMGEAGPALFGALSLIAALVVWCVAVPLVSVQKMDDHYVWLKKINPNYLEQLPGLPR